MSEVELRREAVRRRLAGETTEAVAVALGRTARWVRKWVARHEMAEAGPDWAQSRSRAPKHSPRRTPDRLRAQVLEARAKLEANPMSQYCALAIAWELELLGLDPVPEVWTINRILADAGATRRRSRTPGYKSKGAAYPHPTTTGPGEYHQADLIGPRNLDGGIGFHAFNLIDGDCPGLVSGPGRQSLEDQRALSRMPPSGWVWGLGLLPQGLGRSRVAVAAPGGNRAWRDYPLAESRSQPDLIALED